MFGKKAGGRLGEIDVSGFGFLAGSHEFARLWAEPGGPMTLLFTTQDGSDAGDVPMEAP